MAGVAGERGRAGVRLLHLLRLVHGAGGLARGARHGHPSQALKERQLPQDLKAQGLGEGRRNGQGWCCCGKYFWKSWIFETHLEGWMEAVGGRSGKM